jgi:hypothetical protein
MTAQLFLPHWIVDRMTLDDQAYAEELVANQAIAVACSNRGTYEGVAQWIEHDWVLEVRVD